MLKRILFILNIVSLSFMMAVLSTPVMAQRIGIAAIVNDDVITFTDLEGRIQLNLRAINQQDSEEARAKITPVALSSLIEEQLKLQEAERLDIEVPEDEIESAIDTIANQNKIPVDKFRDVLTQGFGALPSLQQQLRTQIAWAQVVKQRLRPQVNVTEADIEASLSEGVTADQLTGVSLKQLFVTVSDNNNESTVNNARLDANALAYKATDCATMDTLISQQNNELSKNLGVISMGALPPPVVAALDGLPDGQASEPIRAQEGFLIVMICGRSDGEITGALREKIANSIGMERLNRLQQRYLRDLRATAYIDVKI